MELLFDGSGLPLVVNTRGRLTIPRNAQLASIVVLADLTGDAVFDVWHTDYAGYPPTVANSIVGAGSKPSLTGVIKSQNFLTGYTSTTGLSGDTYIVNVDSCSGVTQALVALFFAL